MVKHKHTNTSFLHADLQSLPFAHRVKRTRPALFQYLYFLYIYFSLNLSPSIFLTPTFFSFLLSYFFITPSNLFFFKSNQNKHKRKLTHTQNNKTKKACPFFGDGEKKGTTRNRTTHVNRGMVTFATGEYEDYEYI